MIDPEAIDGLTGNFSYFSLFGFLLLVLVPLVLVIFLRYFVCLLRNKPLPDTKIWMGGLGIYLILATFFSTDFGYVNAPNSEYERLYYGVPFLWLFGFLTVQFWRHGQKKLFITTLILGTLPSFFIIYTLSKPDFEWSFLENRQIPFPFADGDCINLVTVQSNPHDEAVCFRSGNRYISLF